MKNTVNRFLKREKKNSNQFCHKISFLLIPILQILTANLLGGSVHFNHPFRPFYCSYKSYIVYMYISTISSLCLLSGGFADFSDPERDPSRVKPPLRVSPRMLNNFVWGQHIYQAKTKLQKHQRQFKINKTWEAILQRNIRGRIMAEELKT